jgi:hypothetical protein
MEIKKNERENENIAVEGKWKLYVKQKEEKRTEILQGEW